MKKTKFNLLIIAFLVACCPCFAAPVKPVMVQPQVVQTQPAPPPAVDYRYCNKIFKIDCQKLFYLTLSSISANRFSIEEIQSRSGYILFTAGGKKFLASVVAIDSNVSMIKITPCDENYVFPVGIVQNCFKYIELNLATPIEKLNVS